MTKKPPSSPETITTLLTGYTPVQNVFSGKKKKKKKFKKVTLVVIPLFPLSEPSLVSSPNLRMTMTSTAPQNESKIISWSLKFTYSGDTSALKQAWKENNI